MSVDHVKYLEFIQAAITRMANSSFLLKGWTVTLAAALVAVAAKETEIRFPVVALFPALAFWGLDAYYLRHERLFRELYDLARQAPDADLTAAPYSLSTQRFRDHCPGWFRTLWATPVVWLHGIVLASLVVAVVLLTLIKKGAFNGPSCVLQLPL